MSDKDCLQINVFRKLLLFKIKVKDLNSIDLLGRDIILAVCEFRSCQKFDISHRVAEQWLP